MVERLQTQPPTVHDKTTMHGTRKLPPNRQAADEFAGGTLRWHRRRHVIEQSVILVVVEDERGLRPDFRVGGECVKPGADILV
ncbi:hypothetical protein AWL63_15560 [Sphingomonas panacis]|uniref:Uncharacterized protein n=1 Tax=Sphingomonas panacis TaxID=1560345 RepID=A0A1B3ZCK9_9SPHN|nr:hypothetical protein AWL63_15560 [Sphingomonas panacis]